MQRRRVPIIIIIVIICRFLTPLLVDLFFDEGESDNRCSSFTVMILLFQGLMLMLQNLPTHHWTDVEIGLVLAEAYRLKYTFADAPKHFRNDSQAPTNATS